MQSQPAAQDAALMAANPWLGAGKMALDMAGGMGQGPDTLQSGAGGAPITVGGLTIERTSWTMIAGLGVLALAAVFIFKK